MEHSEYMVVICIGIAATIQGVVLLLVEVTAYGAVATGLGALVSLSGIVGAFWNS